MKLYRETSIADFEAWSGAVSTLDRIIAEDKCDELEAILEEQYPDGMDETELNDLLWFEEETIFKWLGIRTESEIRQELKEAKWDLEMLMDNFGEDCFETTEEEAKEIWENDYKDEAEELKEKITKLEEELENI